MINKKPISLNLTKQTTELKELIAEHPDYPIIVLAGQDAVCDEYDYTFCQSVSFEIGQILDCYTPYDGEYVFRTEDDLREAIENALCDDESYNLPDDKFEQLIDEKVKEFEPFWKDVIFIFANN